MLEVETVSFDGTVSRNLCMGIAVMGSAYQLILAADKIRELNPHLQV